LDKADHLILHPIECGLRELTHRPGQLRQGTANGVHDRRNNTGDLVPDPRHEPATTATTGRHRSNRSTRLRQRASRSNMHMVTVLCIRGRAIAERLAMLNVLPPSQREVNEL